MKRLRVLVSSSPLCGFLRKSLLPSLPRPRRMSLEAFLLTFLVTVSAIPSSIAASPPMESVSPGRALSFPADFGAHPEFRTEWWYATGWLEQPDGKPLGFQVTFFRSATAHDAANPSRFAPKQLVIAHAALSDPALGKLLHGQKVAREGFGLAWARTGDTDVKLDQWRLRRGSASDPAKRSVYDTKIVADDFALSLRMTASQPPLLQGEQGYSRKGAKSAQASYYYSEPQLVVTGSVTRAGVTLPVRGSAWLDHEWSTTVLDENATGWDWTGINLTDGGALMAFQIRGKGGEKLWAHATMRDANGSLRQFGPNDVLFRPRRTWRSGRTGASYPVAMSLRTGDLHWQLDPLQDDQELDSRLSTGAVYWEGAVTVRRTLASAAPSGDNNATPSSGLSSSTGSVPDAGSGAAAAKPSGATATLNAGGESSAPNPGSASAAPNELPAVPAGTPAGRGYLELTGYFKPLKL
ncbi:MAG: hydrolase [Herminiimonas sp.]|nr:hydrolase [Herminiimonas sp.]